MQIDLPLIKRNGASSVYRGGENYFFKLTSFVALPRARVIVFNYTATTAGEVITRN